MIRHDRLRQLMAAQQISHRALAEELGISTHSVGKIVNGGKAGSRNVSRIARFFRVSQEYLMGETDDPSISAFEASIDKDEWAIIELFRELAPSGKLAVAEILHTMAQAGKGGGSRLQERKSHFVGPGIRHGQVGYVAQG